MLEDQDKKNFIDKLLLNDDELYSVLKKLAEKNAPTITTTTTVAESQKEIEFTTWADVRTKFNELKQEQENWKNYISKQQKTQDYLAAAAAIIGFAQTFKPTVSGKQSLTTKSLQRLPI